MLTKLDDSIIAYSLVNAESSHGMTVTRGDNQTIIDSKSNRWGIDSNGRITMNGVWEKDYAWKHSGKEECAWHESWEGDYTLLLLYWNGRVYCKCCYYYKDDHHDHHDHDHDDDKTAWYNWLNGEWVEIEDDIASPTSTVDPECTLPPSTGRYESLSQKLILYTVNN